MITIIASAVFLLCIMLLKVDERRRDVAALRLMGISAGSIVRSVMVEAAVVAVLGSGVGVAMGWASAQIINWHYRGVYRTPLAFALVTPGIVAFAVVLSLVLGLGRRFRRGAATRASAGARAAERASRRARADARGAGVLMLLRLAWATLTRHRSRTLLAILGVAVSAAMLLDMVMLSSGMRASFRELLLSRGFQLRLAPKGTLPFDTDATIADAGAISRSARRRCPACKP